MPVISVDFKLWILTDFYLVQMSGSDALRDVYDTVAGRVAIETTRLFEHRQKCHW